MEFPDYTDINVPLPFKPIYSLSYKPLYKYCLLRKKSGTDQRAAAVCAYNLLDLRDFHDLRVPWKLGIKFGKGSKGARHRHTCL